MTGWIAATCQNQNEDLHETLFPHGSTQIARVPDPLGKENIPVARVLVSVTSRTSPVIASNVGI
jgi:hypothetical protein